MYCTVFYVHIKCIIKFLFQVRLSCKKLSAYSAIHLYVQSWKYDMRAFRFPLFSFVFALPPWEFWAFLFRPWWHTVSGKTYCTSMRMSSYKTINVIFVRVHVLCLEQHVLLSHTNKEAISHCCRPITRHTNYHISKILDMHSFRQGLSIKTWDILWYDCMFPLNNTQLSVDIITTFGDMTPGKSLVGSMSRSTSTPEL